jgi:hypothetical protein
VSIELFLRYGCDLLEAVRLTLVPIHRCSLSRLACTSASAAELVVMAG